MRRVELAMNPAVKYGALIVATIALAAALAWLAAPKQGTTTTTTLQIIPVVTPPPKPIELSEWRMFHYNAQHVGGVTQSISLAPRLAWKFKTNGSVASSPAVLNGRVIVGSDDSSLYALNESIAIARSRDKFRSLQ